MSVRGAIAAPAVFLLAMSCTTVNDTDTAARLGEQLVSSAYPGMPQELVQRTVQDADQQLCSRASFHQLDADENRRIIDSAKRSIIYPSSGALMGDWRIGEQLAGNAAGMRIRDGRAERVKENGALCVNCHALDPSDVNVGNLGPTLTAYGMRRGNSDEGVRYTYEKIYNSWAYYPCSNMPRFGRNHFLSPEQIAHVVAYLLDPKSPVNRK